MAASNQKLEELVKKLLIQSTPDSNDRRHQEYVRYLNGFLKFFAVEHELVLANKRVKFLGKEEIIVSGSTAEQWKLRTGKDGGDADFIFVSGVAVIPMSLLVPRKETPSFVWILGEDLQSTLNVSLEDGKYLPSSILRSVHPNVFSHVRAIYKLITVMEDNVPGRKTRVVTTGESTKVGLERNEYRDFVVDENILPPRPNYKRMRSDEKTRHQREKVSQCGMDVMKKLLQMLASFKTPGKSGSQQGQFLNFTHILDEALKEEEQDALTLPMESMSRKDDATQASKGKCVAKAGSSNKGGDDEDDTAEVKFENDLDASSDTECSHADSTSRKRISPKRKMLDRTVEANYGYKTAKDFVPAFRVFGTLPCMLAWRDRTRRWPREDVVEAICQSEIYLVAKRAPVDANEEKDFCLSFNPAEILLAKAMSTVQKKCILVLKSFSKGVLKDVDQAYKERRFTKLTSFHLKTALYWVSETAEPELWRDENLLDAAIRVLQFIRSALEERCMPHFFILSNLLAGMDERYRVDMIAAIQRVERHPVESIEAFFKREDNFGDKPCKVYLSEEVVMRLLDIRNDGGHQNHVEVVRDALVDFQRGFERGPRNEKSEPPIREALDHVIELYMQDEISRAVQRELEKMTNTEVSASTNINLGDFLTGLVGTRTSFQKFLSATDKEEEEKLKNEVKYHGSCFYSGKME